MQVSKKVQFDLAHRLPDHQGKCRNLHGHTYFVEVTLEGDIVDEASLPDTGMIMDFKRLKEIINKWIVEPYDHSTILYKDDPLVQMLQPAIKEGMNIHVVNYIPTAENMAKYFYDSMYIALYKESCTIKSVKVWETPDSYATYAG